MLDFLFDFTTYVSSISMLPLFCYLWGKGYCLYEHIFKKYSYKYTFEDYVDDFISNNNPLLLYTITIILLISIFITIVNLFYTSKILFVLILLFVQIFNLVSLCCADESLFRLIKSKISDDNNDPN